MPVKVSRYLWARTLVSGLETVALVVVNDDVLCDRMGTVVKAVEKAKATVETPSWMTPADVFEVTSDGIREITWKRDGASVEVDLGTVNISRLVFITSDGTLRDRLAKLYATKFADNVKALNPLTTLQRPCP